MPKSENVFCWPKIAFPPENSFELIFGKSLINGAADRPIGVKKIKLFLFYIFYSTSQLQEIFPGERTILIPLAH